MGVVGGVVERLVEGVVVEVVVVISSVAYRFLFPYRLKITS